MSIFPRAVEMFTITYMHRSSVLLREYLGVNLWIKRFTAASEKSVKTELKKRDRAEALIEIQITST